MAFWSNRGGNASGPCSASPRGWRTGSWTSYCGRIAVMPQSYYTPDMNKTLTVRLPEALVAEIEAEARERKRSKSDVVRERLTLASRRDRRRSATLATIGDLVGSVDGLPADLSGRTKAYLRATRYGRKRSG